MIASRPARADAKFWGVSTLVIGVVVHCGPARAEAIKRIEIAGHVAPRCWAVQQASMPVPASALDPETVRTARCTQGTPHLAMRAPPDRNRFPHRAAVEIVVSPQL